VSPADQVEFSFTAQVCRQGNGSFSWAMPEKLQDKQIADAIKEFEESVGKDRPFHVLVDEENGDYVEVFMG